MRPAAKALRLVSVAKLDAKVPLLGQGGEAAAADRGGGGRTAGEELYQQRDSSKSHHPGGAARRIPSSLEEGSFRAIFRVSLQKLD